jgi:hypothetical protein
MTTAPTPAQFDHAGGPTVPPAVVTAYAETSAAWPQLRAPLVLAVIAAAGSTDAARLLVAAPFSPAQLGDLAERADTFHRRFRVAAALPMSEARLNRDWTITRAAIAGCLADVDGPGQDAALWRALTRLHAAVQACDAAAAAFRKSHREQLALAAKGDRDANRLADLARTRLVSIARLDCALWDAAADMVAETVAAFLITRLDQDVWARLQAASDQGDPQPPSGGHRSQT